MPPGQGLGLRRLRFRARAHGCFRCPVNCRKLVTGPPGPASSEYVPEDLPKRRTRLLNKADGKNRESENPEEISLLSGRNPTGCARTPEGNASKQRIGREGEEVAHVFVEYGRNDKTPKGCPTGSCVNGRPPKLADGNMAPQLHPFPNRSPSRQRENPLYLRKLWNKDACRVAGISLFVTGFRSARRRSRGDFWSFWTT